MHKYLLFTTTSCPKCPIFKQALNSFEPKIEFEEVNNLHPDFMNLIQKYGLLSAPNLIILENENILLSSWEISEIEEFLKNGS